MRIRLAHLIAGLVAVTTLLAAGSASAQTVRIVNYSDWAIEFVYLSYTGAWDWGPDQLGDDILYADEYIDIPAYCAYYDLRLVDEDGDECVVSNIYLCNEAIDITNDDLLSCVTETAVFGGVGGSPSATCGIGFELAFILPPLLWMRRRRIASPLGSAIEKEAL